MAQGVLIVEDDGFTRMLLRSHVEQIGFTVVSDCGSANEAMIAAREHQPALVLLDLDLGRGPTGIDVAHAMRSHLPRLGIVLLTSYADFRLIGPQRDLPIGTRALAKRSLTEGRDLADVLRLCAADPLGSQSDITVDASVRLSSGQIEILRLVANGFSNSEIAARRHLSESAVIKAVNRLVTQLGLTPAKGDNQRVMLTQAYFDLTGTAGTRRV